MVAKEGAEGDGEHGGDKEEEENVELTMSLTCSHISPELQFAVKRHCMYCNQKIYDEICTK